MRSAVYKKITVSILALLTLLAMGFYVFGNKNFKKFKRIEQDLERLTSLNHALTKDKRLLRERIHGFRFQRDYQEHVAWEELDMIREGDEVFRFADKKPLSTR